MYYIYMNVSYIPINEIRELNALVSLDFYVLVINLDKLNIPTDTKTDIPDISIERLHQFKKEHGGPLLNEITNEKLKSKSIYSY